jgi:hypothetical protein
MKTHCSPLGIFCGLCVIALFCAGSIARAQYPEDALRLAVPGSGVGARALGMGNAYTGVATDFSAIYWNPAGLAQAEHGEFFMGMSLLNNKNNGTLSSRDALGNATILGPSTSYSTNATSLNALGVVYPVPVRRGSLVLAFGYNRGSNFVSGLSFSGFNKNSTIIQYWAPNGKPYPPEISLAEKLALTDVDTVAKTFRGKIFGDLTQLGTVLESGGLNDWSVSGAVDMARDLSAGITLTFLSGSYRYDRTYREQDNQRLLAAPYDLKQLTLDEFIDGDINGVRAKFGLLYRVPGKFRLGFGIQTPTTLTVKETFGSAATSQFYSVVKGQDTYGPVEEKSSNEYDVHTPWVLSAGASVILRDLVLSADVEYTDWTQLEFAKANDDLIAMNKDFKTLFRGTANLRAGAEYEIPGISLRLRGGFMYTPSPFQGDPSSFDQKHITGGLGFLLNESAMLDLAYARGWWKTYRTNYTPASSAEEDIATNTFLVTLVFRF